MRRSIRLPLASIAVLLAMDGCRNPFDPSCDVELARLTCTAKNSTAVFVYSGELAGLSSGNPLPLADWTVTAHFVVRNKVAANITSITINYTNDKGDPVTAYKSIGGRTFKMAFRLNPVANNNETDEGEGRGNDLPLYVVDAKVITDLPGEGVIFADVVFRGVDENGYDLRLEGRISIFYFP